MVRLNVACCAWILIKLPSSADIFTSLVQPNLFKWNTRNFVAPNSGTDTAESRTNNSKDGNVVFARLACGQVTRNS
jgi:hypothetical protein